MDGAESQDRVFAEALQRHQKGELAEAIRLYREVVRAAPEHAGALNLLGLAYCQSGELAEAVSSIRKALAIDPALAGAHYNLGTVLQALKRHDEAIGHYEKALALDPDDAEALNNLGTALKALDRHDQAIRQFERALALRPGYAEAHLNLGNALQSLDRHEQAIRHYERAIALKPVLAEAHMNLGAALQALNRHEEAVRHLEQALRLRPDLPAAHKNLGDLFLALGRHDDAIRSYEQAIARKPDYAEAHLNCGNAFMALDRREEAIRSYQQAIALEPGYAEAHMNLGAALQRQNRHQDAIRSYRQAFSLKPDSVAAHTNLGSALQELGRHDEALRCYDKALSIKPDDVEAARNRCLLYLSLGRFREGWDLYEQRYDPRFGGVYPRAYSQPRWNGERLKGTLLVWGDQGLGDQIIYAGIVPDLAGRVDAVVLELEPRLVPLYARSFPGVRVIAQGREQAGRVDAQAPLASLGKHFRLDWKSFPRREQGYLVADEVRTKELRARLSRDARAVIGLSWISVNPKIGKSKSAPLRDFETILRLPGCRFVDLQYGDTRAERETVERELGVRIERLEDIDNTNDIDGLAALITACDLVVTVSNTTAHLAGALGRPTRVFVPFGHARLWYWFQEREDSPWYPRLRVRRQKANQSWAELIASIAEDVSNFVKSIPRGKSPRADARIDRR